MATMEVTGVPCTRTRLPTVDQWKNLPSSKDSLASQGWCRAVGFGMAISKVCLVRGSSRYGAAQTAVEVYSLHW